MSMRIRVRRSDNKYFSEVVSDWVDSPDTWLGTDLDGTLTKWQKDVTSLTELWKPGYRYDVNSQARDQVQFPGPNWQTSFSTHTFYYDTLAPESAVTLPENNSWKRSMATISGTVNDKPEAGAGAMPSGPKLVQVTIQRMSDNNYWDQTGFSSSVSSFVPAQVWQSSWTYNIPDAYWTTDTSYTIVCRAYDNANNLAWGTTNYFIYDTTNPFESVMVDTCVILVQKEQ